VRPWTLAKYLVLVIASFYGVEAGVNLMTQPSDFTFWGGFCLLAFLFFVWVELGIKAFNKIKEWKNENS